jgi:hypothetical protein
MDGEAVGDVPVPSRVDTGLLRDNGNRGGGPITLITDQVHQGVKGRECSWIGGAASIMLLTQWAQLAS